MYEMCFKSAIESEKNVLSPRNYFRGMLGALNFDQKLFSENFGRNFCESTKIFAFWVHTPIFGPFFDIFEKFEEFRALFIP